MQEELNHFRPLDLGEVVHWLVTRILRNLQIGRLEVKRMKTSEARSREVDLDRWLRER
jgi:hypothetical protein